MIITICPVCKLSINDTEGFLYGSVSSSPYRTFRVHSSPGTTPGSSLLTCVDRLVDAAISGTLSLNGGSGSDSKADALARVLDAIEKNPAHADRLLTLAERALS